MKSQKLRAAAGILPGLCAILFFLLMPLLHASAGASFADEFAAVPETIIVAGNPNFAPYESYNAETGRYDGILPDIFHAISQTTGINFIYLHSDSEADRAAQFISGEAQILSGCLLDSESLARFSPAATASLVEYESNGRLQTIGIAFSPGLSAETIETITNAFSAACSRQLSSSLAAALNNPQAGARSYSPLLIVLLAAATLFAASAAVFYARKAEKLRPKENIDELTGTMDREGFRVKFKELADKYSDAAYSLACIGFDMSHVNETRGEKAADEQLRAAADSLKAYIPEPEVLARYPGGSMLVLRLFSSVREMEEWIAYILPELNRFCESRRMDEKSRFYAGIYHMQTHDRDIDKACRIARRAYQDARLRNEPYVIAGDSSAQDDTMRDILSRDVPVALDSDAFQIYLQPVVHAATGKVAGAEALSRWNHPELGLLPPDRYIDMMTSNGNVAELDFYLLERVCEILHRWKKAGCPYWLSANFTRQTITRPDFLERIASITGKYDFDHNRLLIEITENCLVSNSQLAHDNLYKIAGMGFRISLDDLGDGYTLFSDLKDYPLSIAKMDRHLLPEKNDEAGHRLYRQLTSLCRGLGMTVVSEGIETHEQWEFCRNAGCEYLQGYYFYRPLPLAEFENLLAASH